MLPTIATGNVGSALAGEYEVANSLRFNSASSDNLERTAGSTGNRKTLTISYWLKRGLLATSSTQGVLNAGILSNGDNHSFCGFDYQNDKARIQTTTSNITLLELTTNSEFRDTSAWYHFVWKVDTTQATESNRVKLYVNGVEHSLTGTFPTQNEDTWWNYADKHIIGSRFTDYLDGYLTEMILIDGQALDPTSFGEFDSDTNIWKPIDVSGLTFGTNGFYLDFENSGSLGADVSGNGNNFTVNNLTSVDQSTDTCTNNFATFNALLPNSASITYSEGNLKANASAWKGVAGTILVNTGKWYAEIEWDSGSYMMIGIVGEDDMNDNGDHYGTRATGYQYYGADGTIRNNDSTVATYSSYTTGDIIGVCLDCDNNKVYWSKNGTWQNSADPSAGTNGLSITANKYYTFACSLGGTAIANFGSPMTSISSGNSDPNGYGNFEYGTENFYALNTKNLAEYG